jgi:hypothetical protein
VKKLLLCAGLSLGSFASAVNLSELTREEVCIEADYIFLYSSGKSLTIELKDNDLSLLLSAGFRNKTKAIDTTTCKYSLRITAFRGDIGIYDGIVNFTLIPYRKEDSINARNSWTAYITKSEDFLVSLKEILEPISQRFLTDWVNSRN